MVTVEGQYAEFCFFRPQARQVYLLGDFNNWREGELPMSRTATGYWVARLCLPVGLHRFRYRADGQWFVDYAAFGIEYGPFGVDGFVYVRPTADSGKTKSSDMQPRAILYPKRTSAPQENDQTTKRSRPIVPLRGQRRVTG